MAKVRNTKNELKAQRDALKRCQRYLPTLQLKKQQLQLEVRQAEQRIDENLARERALRAGVDGWVQCFAEDLDPTAWFVAIALRTGETNVAGVTIPVLREVVVERSVPDLFATPPWLDDALDHLEQVLRVRLERQVLEQQQALLRAELVTTNQRVNLFERVKIPACKDAIRRVRIFLGDMQTLDVARGKIAKRKVGGREPAGAETVP